MSKIKINLAISALIIVTSACSALTTTPPPSTPTAVTILEPSQTQSPRTATPTQAQVTIPQTADEVPRIGLENAKSAFDNKSALFIDTRSKQEYEAKHIQDAIYIGDFEIDPKLGLDKNQWIITYCTWPNEHTSARAALNLIQKGYTNVAPLLGGLQAWIDAGYPTQP